MHAADCDQLIVERDDGVGVAGAEHVLAEPAACGGGGKPEDDVRTVMQDLQDVQTGGNAELACKQTGAPEALLA